MPRTSTRLASAMHPLDKNGFIPLYYQIQRALMEKIQSGELSEGNPLASEEELARTYQVSRMTVRQAVRGLKLTGFAFSEKGRGTFVTRPKLEKNILRIQGFTENMQKRGIKPSSRILKQTVIQVDEIWAQKYRLEVGEELMLLRRLRLADGAPIALEQSCVPLKNFPGLNRINFAKHSLYQILRENYGVCMAWADETIEALIASSEEAKLLTVPRRSSILSISRILTTTEDALIEVAQTRYRGDRYRVSIRIPATTIE